MSNLYALAKVVNAEALKRFKSADSEFYVEPRISTEGGKELPGSDVLGLGAKILVVGPPGSGKTTLLGRMAITLSATFLELTIANRKNAICPLLIQCRDLREKDHYANVLDLVSPVVERMTGGSFLSTALREAFSKGRILLLLDGFDELSGEKFRESFSTLIRRFSFEYPLTPIVVSSRPISALGGLPDFLIAQLLGLSAERLKLHIMRLAEGNSNANDFLSALTSNNRLLILAENPLFLNLLWRIFQQSARFPLSIAGVFRDFTEIMLGAWDRKKGIGPRTMFSIRHLYDVLEKIAKWAWENDLISIPLDIVHELATRGLADMGGDGSNAQSLVYSLETTGILVAESSQVVSFAHLMFQEYFVASAAAKDATFLFSLTANPRAKEVILFVAAMIEDISVLVESLISRGEYMLAARCLSASESQNEPLMQFTVGEIVRELGESIAKRISDYVEGKARKQAEVPHVELLSKWDLVTEEGIASHLKGERFEAFMVSFFEQTFKIVKRRLVTENGELDILLENTRVDPFWMEFGGDISVECKNTRERTPSKEVGNFADKVNQANQKLGLFVSVAGFTEDAERRLLNHSSGKGALIVPIDGEKILGMLTTRKDFEAFFKECIRTVRYLQKY